MNLKKILISLGLAIIIIISMNTSVRAENGSENSDLPLSNKRLFSKMLTAIGVANPDYAFKFSDIFGSSEKNYGQNLYLAIYQKVVVEPEIEAIQMVGQAKGLNTVETEAVLNGSLEPLLQRYPKVTQEQAMAWARQMRDLYGDYTDSENLRAETKASVTPSELFANNDTSDSGFDLIADLNDIEMILFKKVTPGDINLIYTAGHPNEAVLPPQKTEKEAQPTYPYPQMGAVSGGITNNNKTGISGISGAIGSSKTFGNLGNLVNPAAYEPAQEDCPPDTNLDNAVDDYDAKNPPGNPKPSGGNIGGAAGGGNTGGGAGTGGTEGEPDIFAINPNVTVLDEKELKPAEAGDWKDGQLCTNNKRFCIEITTHASKYNLYYPADPCIACHVEKINESLTKLVSHNLAPRKLTGNLMEMAKCKSGYNFSDFVNINIITVPMPVIVPPKMEAIFGRNVIDEFKKFLNKYTLFPVDSTTKATEIAESHSSSETTQDDMLREIQNMIYKAKIEAEKQVKNKQTLDTSSVQEEFYKSLLYQLEEMKTLFDSFRQQFENLNAKCNVIKNKEYVD